MFFTLMFFSLYSFSYAFTPTFPVPGSYSPSPCIPSSTQDTNYSCAHATEPEFFWYIITEDTTCDWMQIEFTTGTLVGTPNASQVGACTVAYQRVDDTPLGEAFILNVSVQNLAPTLSISNSSINEDAPLTLIKDDNEVEANEESFGLGSYSLDFFSTTPPACNDVASVIINSVTGALSFKPNQNAFGNCNMLVRYEDGFGGVVTDELQVTINPINDAPTLTLEGDLFIFQNNGIDLTAVGSDVDGDSLFYTLGSLNTCNWITVNSTSGVF